MTPEMSLWVRDIVTAVLMLGGAAFMILASVGMLRLPDIFTRMHAATKSGTLGVAGVMLATAVHFAQVGVTTQVLLTVVFVFLTAPVAAHIIARAAYMVGVPMWERSVVDELKGHVPGDSKDGGEGEADPPPSSSSTGTQEGDQA